MLTADRRIDASRLAWSWAGRRRFRPGARDSPRSCSPELAASSRGDAADRPASRSRRPARPQRRRRLRPRSRRIPCRPAPARRRRSAGMPSCVCSAGQTPRTAPSSRRRAGRRGRRSGTPSDQAAPSGERPSAKLSGLQLAPQASNVPSARSARHAISGGDATGVNATPSADVNTPPFTVATITVPPSRNTTPRIASLVVSTSCHVPPPSFERYSRSPAGGAALRARVEDVLVDRRHRLDPDQRRVGQLDAVERHRRPVRAGVVRAPDVHDRRGRSAVGVDLADLVARDIDATGVRRRDQEALPPDLRRLQSGWREGARAVGRSVHLVGQAALGGGDPDLAVRAEGRSRRPTWLAKRPGSVAGRLVATRSSCRATPAARRRWSRRSCRRRRSRSWDRTCPSRPIASSHAQWKVAPSSWLISSPNVVPRYMSSRSPGRTATLGRRREATVGAGDRRPQDSAGNGGDDSAAHEREPYRAAWRIPAACRPTITAAPITPAATSSRTTPTPPGRFSSSQRTGGGR